MKQIFLIFLTLCIVSCQSEGPSETGDDKLDSTVVEKVYQDGSKYLGQMDGNGQHHGQGVHQWGNGSRFDGQWCEGKPHGKGVLTTRKGSSYSGQFKDGKYHGHGVKIWHDGRKYVGEWENGCPTGGKFHHLDGRVTESFKNDAGEWVHKSLK